MSAPKRLSQFVKPAEGRPSEHDWEQVRQRVRRRRIQRVVTPVVALLLVGVAAAGLGWRARQPELLQAGRLAEAIGQPRTARLEDGSQLAIAEGGALRLEASSEEDVVIVLERGSASFTVNKRKAGRFTVRAGDVDLEVVGTVFRVQRAAEFVTVDVQEGVVEAHQGEQVVRLSRGQHWVSRPPEKVEAVNLEELPLEHEDAEVLEHAEEHAPPSPARPRHRPSVKTSKHAQAEPDEVSLPPEPAGARDSGVADEPTPADLFRDAMRDRNQGEVRRAMAGFQLVCERWPSSAFAPMSAFEWGRLAIDVEHDPRLAARAFERALELAKAPSLVEDTLARLAEAYSRFDVPACRRVSTEYLRRFPSGPHVVGVKKACPAPE